MECGDRSGRNGYEIWFRKPANAFLLMPLTVLAFTVLFTIITVPQDSYASSLSITFPTPGTYTMTFRDVSSGSPTPVPVISFDKSAYGKGASGTITISDFNGNLDPFTLDTIFPKVNGAVIPLGETTPNSAIFTGTFTAGVGGNTVNYEPDPPDSVRAFVSVTTTATPQTVTIEDFPMFQGTCIGGDDIVT